MKVYYIYFLPSTPFSSPIFSPLKSLSCIQTVLKNRAHTKKTPKGQNKD